MHDARDAEDKRLLEAKEHTQLLENYVYLVQEWAAVRVRDRQAADEVVQRVFLRLASELASGQEKLARLTAQLEEQFAESAELEPTIRVSLSRVLHARRAARRALLPKLISGELRVRDELSNRS
jgi:DNA-directed RNA polymerase specialized sigma24 family protein